MEDAVIIRQGSGSIIVPLSVVSDKEVFDPLDPEILFFPNGWVRRFKKGGTSYMAVFSTETGNFSGYYSEENFWRYNYNASDQKGTQASIPSLGKAFQNSIPIFSLPRETKVYISHEIISENSSNDNFSLQTKYGYKLLKDISSPLTFQETLEDFTTTEVNLTNKFDNLLTKYGQYILDKKFMIPDGSLTSLNANQKGVLFEILFVFNEILRDDNLTSYFENINVLSVIKKHLEIPIRYEPADNTIDLPYHGFYNEEYFATFRLRLIEFRYWLIRYNTNYTEIDSNDLMVYLVNLFTVTDLSILPYETKKTLLTGILEDNFWIIGDWYFNELNEEEAIVKIVQSIARGTVTTIENVDEINTFMDYLEGVYDTSDSKSLYEVLYRRINQNVNRKNLVNAIYSLWSISHYNPYRSGEFEAEILDKFTYREKRPEDFSRYASPLVINYKSDKTLNYYETNFSFRFVNKNGNQILAAQDGEELGTKFNFYEYRIFQPVSLLRTDNENGTYMPVINGNPEDPNNLIPLFYLKYVDDFNDWESFKFVVGVVVDVALTFTGVGNLAKLRHLRHVAKLKWGLPEFKIIIGALEFTSGVASLTQSFLTNDCQIHSNPDGSPPTDPSDPNFHNYQFCKELSQFLFWLEMATISVDVITELAVKRAAKRLKNTGAAASFPNDYPSNFPVEASQEIDKLVANYDQLLPGFLTRLRSTELNMSNLADKLEALPLDKQREFLDDMALANPDTLRKFNEDQDLLGLWDEIEHLKDVRRNVEFLKAYQYLNLEVIKRKFTQLVERNGEWVGGHFGPALFDSSNSIYAILDTGATVYRHQVGKRIYKQTRNNALRMWKGGQNKRKKTWHTWIEGITQQEYIEDISFAWMNRKEIPPPEISNFGGTRKTFISNLEDGTVVKFNTEEPYYIEELDQVFTDFLTNIRIEI